MVEEFNLGRDMRRLRVVGCLIEKLVVDCKGQTDTDGRYVVNGRRPADLDADEAVDDEATPPHSLADLLLDDVVCEVGRVEIEAQLLCCADSQPNDGPTVVEFQRAVQIVAH